MKLRNYTIFVAAIFCACGSDGQNPGNPDGGVLDAPVDPEGPVFLSFDTNVDQLTEGETVRFSAVLTDPDGIDDLIGGVLKSADGEISYGSFATSGQEGSYSLELSWAEFDQADTLEFESERERVFKAEFFDEAGHVNAQTLTLRFYCDGDDGWSCSGRCKMTSRDRSNCGECRNVCMLGGGSCTGGDCLVSREVSWPNDERMSCDAVCALSSLRCQPSCSASSHPSGFSVFELGPYASSSRYSQNAPMLYDTDCAAVPPQVYMGTGWGRTTCCCAE